MSSEDDELVRLLGGANLADGVEDRDGTGYELVAYVQLHTRLGGRGPTRQAAEHRVVVVGHAAGGYFVMSAGPFVADPRSKGSQQAERPFRVMQHSGDAFAFAQFLLGENHAPVHRIGAVLAR